MRLYSGTSTDFIEDSVHNRIADKLRDAYFVTYRRETSRRKHSTRKGTMRTPVTHCSD